jgi:hypothetical protein
MIRRLHLSVILILAAILWGGLLLLEGVPVTVSWIRPISAVTAILLGLLGAFDLFLWRLRLLQGWFVKKPVLRGTWAATLVSNWVNPQTGEKVAPIPAYVVIRQTFSFLSLRLFTKESRSEVLGAEVIRAQDGAYCIVGVYRNEPRLEVRHRSPIHHGAIYLHVVGSPVIRLEGHYWTDRDTNGSMELTQRNKKLADDFQTAQELMATGGSPAAATPPNLLPP